MQYTGERSSRLETTANLADVLGIEIKSLSEVLLVAAMADYATSYLNQPIEVSELRVSLVAEMRTAPYPQLLLRVSRGSTVPHSPRRPIADVLL